jgi:chromosome segregation ATPase
VQEELETYYLRVLESEKSYKQQAQTLAINKQELVEAYKQIQLIDNDRQFSKQENKRIVALNEKLETEIKVTRQRLDEAESQAKYVDANIQSISNKQSELQVQVTVLDMELSNARKSLDDKGKENELLLLQLHQVQEELESYFLKYQEIKSTKPEINNSSNSTLDKSNIKEEQKQHNKVHLLLSYLEKRRSARNIRRQISLIKQSGLFDERWYLNEYSDVAQSGIDPIKHYLKFGAEEGRDPSLAFDTRYYQECNPDISTSAINPLLHYISHGKAEGRRPHA